MTQHILNCTNAEDIVCTAQIEKASDLFQKHGSLVLCGKAGEGKSTTAHYILKDYEKSHRCLILAGEVIPEISISDFDIVVFDDVLARYNIDRLLPLLITTKYRSESGNLKVIFIIKDQLILKEAEVRGLHKLFAQVVTFSSAYLSVKEKENMLKKVLLREKKDPRCININLCTRFCSTQIGFPYCCTLFASETSLFEKGEKFFERPYRAIIAHIHSLIPEEFLALAFLFLCGGMIKATHVESDFKEIKHPLLSRLQKSIMQGRHVACQIESYTETLRRLRKGVYVKFSNQHYAFAHSVIYQSMGILLGKKIPEEAIKTCNIDFLCNCISVESHEEKEDDDMLTLNEDSWSYLAKRLVQEVCENDNLDIVACHQALNSEAFVDLMFDQLEDPDLFLRKEKQMKGKTLQFSSESIKGDCKNIHLIGRLVEILECPDASHDASEDCWRCDQLSKMFLICCESGSSCAYKILQRHVTKPNMYHLKSAILGSNVEIVKDVLYNVKSHNSKYTEDLTIVLVAAKCGSQEEIVDMLVESGFEVNEQHILQAIACCSCSKSTKQCHHTRVAKHMLTILKDNGKFDITNKYVIFGAMLSALTGKFEMNKLLVQHGISCEPEWLTFGITNTIIQLNGRYLHEDKELRYTLICQMLLLLKRIKSNWVDFPTFYDSIPDIPELDMGCVESLFLDSIECGMQKRGKCNMDAHIQLSEISDSFEKILKLFELQKNGHDCENCPCLREAILNLKADEKWDGNEKRAVQAMCLAGVAGCSKAFSLLLDNGVPVSTEIVLKTIKSCSKICLISSDCGHSKIIEASFQRLRATSSLPVGILEWSKAASKACKNSRHEICKILANAGVIDMPQCMKLPQDDTHLKFEVLCTKHPSVFEQIIERSKLHGIWNPKESTVVELSLQLCFQGDNERFRILEKAGASIDSDHILKTLKGCRCRKPGCGHQLILCLIYSTLSSSEHSLVCQRITGKQAQIPLANPFKAYSIQSAYRKAPHYLKECMSAIKKMLIRLAANRREEFNSKLFDVIEDLICGPAFLYHEELSEQFDRIPYDIWNCSALLVINILQNLRTLPAIIDYISLFIEKVAKLFTSNFVLILYNYCEETSSLLPAVNFLRSCRTISKLTMDSFFELILRSRCRWRDTCMRLLIDKAVFSGVWDSDSRDRDQALHHACGVGDYMMFNVLTSAQVIPTLEMVQTLIQNHYKSEHDFMRHYRLKYLHDSENKFGTKCFHVECIEDIIAILKKRGIWNPASIKVVTTMDHGDEDEMIDMLEQERITVRRHQYFDKDCSADIKPVRVHISSSKHLNVDTTVHVQNKMKTESEAEASEMYVMKPSAEANQQKMRKVLGDFLERKPLEQAEFKECFVKPLDKDNKQMVPLSPGNFLERVITSLTGNSAATDDSEDIIRSPQQSGEHVVLSEPTMATLYEILQQHFNKCTLMGCQHTQQVRDKIVLLKAVGNWNPSSLVITQVTEMETEDPMLDILHDAGLNVKKLLHLMKSTPSLQTFRVRLRR